MDTPAFSPQPSLRFDFNKAVADARRDFPEATQKIAFFDLDAPDVDAQMQKFYDGLSPDAKKNIDELRYEDPDFLTSRSNPHAWRSKEGVGVLMAYGTRTHLNEMEKIAYNPADPQKHLYYTFAHELGHLVVKDADRPGNYAEHAADSFAAVRGFQSGFLNRKDVKEISDGRAMLGWFNRDVTHITSMSLDALVINPKQIDFITLTPAETAKVSQRHGEKFSTDYEPGSARALWSALPLWSLTSDQRRADGLAGLGNVVLNNERSSLTFYVAARMLLTAQAKKEAGDPAAAAVDFTGEKWDKVFARIDRAKKSRDIGADQSLENDVHTKQKNTIQRFVQRIKPLSV